MRAIALFLACGLALPWGSQETVMRVRHVMSTDEIIFDPARVSPSEIRQWIQLSPNLAWDNGYLSPEVIESCDAKDPRYRGCGKEHEQVNLENAQLNIEKIRSRIHTLDAGGYPADLSQVVLYARRIQSFGLWRDTQLVAFEKTGDPSTLSSRYDTIDPRLSCGGVLDSIAKAQTKAQDSHLARFDWANCVWFAEKEKIGEYPKDDWKNFLASRGIREHDVQENVDNPSR